MTDSFALCEVTLNAAIARIVTQSHTLDACTAIGEYRRAPDSD